jgi:hypothetical protein
MSIRYEESRLTALRMALDFSTLGGGVYLHRRKPQLVIHREAVLLACNSSKNPSDDEWAEIGYEIFRSLGPRIALLSGTDQNSFEVLIVERLSDVP